MTFRTTVELGGKTATGFEVPADVVEALGEGRRPRVVVTIGSHTYRSTIAVYGERFMLPLNAANRSAAGVAAGDAIDVDVGPDTAQRHVTVPPDVEALLATEPEVRERFAALSYTRRREYVEGIESAKKPETRERRITRMLDELRTN